MRVLDALGQPADEAHFRASVQPLDPDGVVRGWQLELLVEGLEAAQGLFEGTVVLETGYELEPELRVPFKGVVR